MRRRITSISLGLMMVFAFSFAVVPPETAEAKATTTFKQQILEPDCYDIVVSTEGKTIDYIATFDCTYRLPDGTAFTPSFSKDKPLSLQ